MRRLVLLLGLAVLAGAACAHAPNARRAGRFASAPAADSATVLLWRLDETIGERVADAGPRRLDAVTGRATRTDFGRFGSARVFTRSLQSFLYLPHQPGLESGASLSIEAWIRVSTLGAQEGTPLVARWTEQANARSWMLMLVGRKSYVGQQAEPGPQYLVDLVASAPAGHLVFACQPDEASVPLTFVSNRPVEMERWTHVAATHDGEVVRLYLDGTLDAQYELRGRIRPSGAPVLSGNYFDPRFIDLEGGVPTVSGGETTALYALDGAMDEIRISSIARPDFVHVTGR